MEKMTNKEIVEKIKECVCKADQAKAKEKSFAYAYAYGTLKASLKILIEKIEEAGSKE